MTLNIPTILTLFRIAVIPVLIATFYLPVPGARTISAIVFMIAAFSDWLDGYLARKLNQTSRFGEFLDPVADKLIVTTVLVMLLQENPTFLFMISTVVIIGREITVSALREWMAEIGQRTSVAVSVTGKIKTVVQMIAITLLLYQAPIFDISAHFVGLMTLYVSVFLTLWSMIKYLVVAWPVLRDSDA